MSCPTVEKLGALTAEKFDVLGAINGHLREVFEGAVSCHLIDHGRVELKIVEGFQKTPDGVYQEFKVALDALAEGWSPNVQFAFDFTVPRQG
jgi:hypothetical protein